MPGERNPRISGRRIRGRKLTDWESATRIRGIIGQYGKKSRDAKEEAARQEVLLEQWINLEGAEKIEWYTTTGSRHKVISEFDESDWAGYRGTWATFAKIKQRYWWKNI